MFDTLEMSLTVLEQLAPLEIKLRQRRKSLADEVGRAAESIALNVSEARQRAGLDRADLFRRAAGSASELTTALRIARARGYITPGDFAPSTWCWIGFARCCGGSRIERRSRDGSPRRRRSRPSMPTSLETVPPRYLCTDGGERSPRRAQAIPSSRSKLAPDEGESERKPRKSKINGASQESAQAKTQRQFTACCARFTAIHSVAVSGEAVGRRHWDARLIGIRNSRSLPEAIWTRTVGSGL
jgi:four helix bundle protein